MDQIGYITRKATPAEAPEIRAMQERSLRALGTKIYSLAAIERFIEIVSTMDDAVIAEGHFFVAVTPEDEIVASAGWSRTAPPFAVPLTAGDASGFASVRSVFVDPRYAGRGVASTLMQVTEWDAIFHEVRHLAAVATLGAVQFCHRQGYATVSATSFDLGDGTGFALVNMEKHLPAIYRREVA